jgi:hypothetical protein
MLVQVGQVRIKVPDRASVIACQYRYLFGRQTYPCHPSNPWLLLFGGLKILAWDYYDVISPVACSRQRGRHA